MGLLPREMCMRRMYGCGVVGDRSVLRGYLPHHCFYGAL